MQKFEYLQLSINYYSSAIEAILLSNNEDSTVWKGFQNYLELLHTQGWTLINETQSGKGQSRTYDFKRPVD
jgi:hypothetical protein